jgi:hypothetical protein
MEKPFLKFILSFIACIGLFSCENSLEIELQNYESKLVVDGYIEDRQYPVVVLTRSAAYFSTIDSTALRELVVSRAKVTVSDGELEEVLTLKKNSTYFPPYVYEGTQIKGEAGKTYNLKIELEGKSYEASTTIPAPAFLDSLWFSSAGRTDSLGYLYGRFQDNGETEDYYRIFTKRLNEDNKFVPIYLSAIGDKYFNGKSFTFSFLRGSESLSDARDDLHFRQGDTVRVKLCTMDRAHFDFWRTLERELYVTGNPFSSSGNAILSNVSGGALGVWGGYNPTVYQFVIPSR